MVWEGHRSRLCKCNNFNENGLFGRYSKRLTFSICVRSMKCGKVLPGCRYAAFAFLFFSALNFAHRNFVAFEIFALAAADNTRFLT